MSDTTPDATPRQNGATDDTREMTPEDAARHYGVSLRTIQRRLHNGDLQEITRDGQRLVIVADATDDAPRVVTNSDIDATDDSVSRHPDATLLEHLQAENAYLKTQIDAWRLQAEAANRTASETAAALRKALEALPKELPPAADQQPQTDAATTSTPATNQEPPATAQDEISGDQVESAAPTSPAKSTFISRIMGRLARR